MKRIAVLGATGSIGASALDVISRHPGRYRASVLTAHKNVDALAKLCQRFVPDLAIIDAPFETDLRRALNDLPTKVTSGPDALCEAAASDLCDAVLAAIVGAAGLKSTLAAVQANKQVLLANKEAVVMAGPLLLKALRNGTGSVIPVDSEHNAIFQCLPHHRQKLGDADWERSGVRRLVLTASGGPFRDKRLNELREVTPEQACAHPNWHMGRKISVDSATMMNKGLEVIEAHWLFGACPERIDVVVHPESVIHSLVEYVDGSTLAQLGNPDMRTALACALAWPERIDSGVAPLDLLKTGTLKFEAPDVKLFRCLPLAYRSLQAGGTAPTVMNAANEVAVAAFLERRLAFLAIADVIEATLDTVASSPIDGLDSVLYADLTAREAATRIMLKNKTPSVCYV